MGLMNVHKEKENASYNLVGLMYTADEISVTRYCSSNCYTLRDLEKMNFNLSSSLIDASFILTVDGLASLELPSFFSSGLSGNLPEYLSNSNLSGTLPVQLINGSSHLGTLNLANNNLQGEIIFPNVFAATGLRLLRLDHNKFYGDIPVMSSIVSLMVMDLGNNFFSGKIARWICDLTSLAAVNLANNQLQGCLSQLEFLDLSENNLSSAITLCLSCGSIMHALSNSSNLVALDLSNSNFYGVSPGVGNHPSLSILLLRANQFSGTFPDQLCSLRQLSMIDLSVNNPSGHLPSCLDQMNFAEEVFGKVDTAPYCIEETVTEWSSSSYFTKNTSSEFDYYDVHVQNQWLKGIQP
ncbi:receptor-like protein 13 [Rhodamnia argentea]|uniref:Receptor-like protein 13 n=1 Tax=Rhodamnia argentea TaxID=178133 RepID=A0ABM3HBQ0_9MYRT|nr:receptor-like protein 13 [Rhodamnia argentea]